MAASSRASLFSVAAVTLGLVLGSTAGAAPAVWAASDAPGAATSIAGPTSAPSGSPTAAPAETPAATPTTGPTVATQTAPAVAATTASSPSSTQASDAGSAPVALAVTDEPGGRLLQSGAANRVAPTAAAGFACVGSGAYVIEQSGRVRAATFAANGTGSVAGASSATAGDLGSFRAANYMNGLAMNSAGSRMMAFSRVAPRTIQFYFADAANAWRNTNDQFFTELVRSFNGGAINPLDGNYYFGGFGNGSAALDYMLFKYSVATGDVSFVGKVLFTLTAANGDANNGDLTFDRAGNLYVISTPAPSDRDATVETRVVRVATMASATGSEADYLGAYAPNSYTTTRDGANGVAFAADGGIVISSLANNDYNGVRKYNPATGAVLGTFSSGGAAPEDRHFQDLANCYGPGTLTVKKDVVGRSRAADQFTLAVTASATYATATTTGSSTGVQPEFVGPVPALAGGQYTVSEAMAPGSASGLDRYVSSVACADETGTAVAVQANGTLQMPNRADTAVVCTYTNRPLSATVTVRKNVQDAAGANPRPGEGWTLGSAATASSGSVTQSPTSTTQVTPASGAVSWAVDFGGSTARATVRVSETQQTGFRFVEGSCTVSSASGQTRTVTIGAATGTDVAGVAPEDTVDCTLVNRPAGTLTLRKVVDNTFGGSSTIADWTLAGTGPTPVSGKTGEAAVTNASVLAGAYTLSESGGTAGYAAGAWSCTGGSVSGSTVTVAQGATVECVITNTARSGTAVWTKTAQDGTTLLGKSEWTITGPGFASPGNVVADCLASPCTGADQDPTPGAFRLIALRWGSYTATESRAPAGYVAERTFTFAVTATTAGTELNLGPQRNSQQVVPTIPLTGGLGEHVFLLGGAGLLVSAALVLLAIRVRRRLHRTIP